MASNRLKRFEETKRPNGRTLAEFLNKNGKLLPAEELLLAKCGEGELAKIDQERPEPLIAIFSSQSATETPQQFFGDVAAKRKIAQPETFRDGENRDPESEALNKLATERWRRIPRRRGATAGPTPESVWLLAVQLAAELNTIFSLPLALGARIDWLVAETTASRRGWRIPQGSKRRWLSTQSLKDEFAQRRVRADFIRFLALGGDTNAAVHEHGVRVKGAWIDGDLDLENCHVPAELTLSCCRLEGMLTLRDAKLFVLGLSGSAIPEISANRLHCAGFVDLRLSHAKRVRLSGARIGGDVFCNQATFIGETDYALSLDDAEINGSVFASENFRAIGPVDLFGADISGSFVSNGGLFDGRGDVALSCEATKIGGYAFLRNGFQAIGEVKFTGANIGLNLEMYGRRAKRATGRGPALS